MLSSTWHSIRRINPTSRLEVSATRTRPSRSLTTALKAKQSAQPLSFAWTRTPFIQHHTRSSPSTTSSSARYYASKTLNNSAADLESLETIAQCQQTVDALSSALRVSGADFALELDNLSQLLQDCSDKKLEAFVSPLLRLWLSSELDIPLTERTRALELASSYYYNTQLLVNFETIVFNARKNLKLVPSPETYVQLLALSGRHKQLPSVEMAFKLWKKDYGLTYELNSDAVQDSLLDQEAILAAALPNAPIESRRTATAFFEYIKDSDHASVVSSLFSATMKAAAKTRNLDAAELIFQEALMVLKDNQQVHDTMAEIYCNSNRVEKAHKLLFLMPNKENSVLVVLDACARLKNYHLAEKVFYDSYSAFKLPSTADIWNALLGVYITRDEMNVAHDRFIDMLQSKQSARPNLQTYERMITGHVRAKDAQRAEEMFKHAKSNKIEISATIYAWIMEAYIDAKDYDKTFGIVHAMQERGLILPQKFKNLLLQRCRRTDGLMEQYEKYFGTAPEPFDDLKEVRGHAEAKRAFDKQSAEEAKLRKKAAKAGSSSSVPSHAQTGTLENSTEGELVDGVNKESGLEASELDDDNTQFVDVVEGAESHEFGLLEEVVEDDTEMSMEEWMKDDMGEQGWMDFSKPDPSSSKKYKRIHNVNLRYKDVFEVSGWSDPLDVQGNVKPKEWQIVADPFSKTKPEVSEKKREQRRISSQIETLQQEVIDKIEAESERSKLKQQRRRERAYGQTRRYIDDPKKLRKEKEDKDRRRGPPAGSTFSFR